MQKPSLLVVDDEPGFSRLMALSLGREGFEVRTVPNGEDALDMAAEIHPDAVILDLGLPGMDGLAVLKELRERTNMPVVVVTGARTTESVRRGLDEGADDYLTKPFSPTELAARVRAVLRRRHRSRQRQYRVADCIVDLDARTIEPVEGARPTPSTHSIGRGGWRLLEAFLSNEGKILYRDELLDAAFGPDYRGDSGYLQEQVRRLRRGLGIPAWSEGPIRTVHGVGYAFDAVGEIPVGRPRRPRRAGGFTSESDGAPHRDAARPPRDADRAVAGTLARSG
ncbi:MAG TPA: response regulator transcription factor [Candidatus Limnocylindrales bacterium]|jgi:DNA-binding response OmpR family regulator